MKSFKILILQKIYKNMRSNNSYFIEELIIEEAEAKKLKGFIFNYLQAF